MVSLAHRAIKAVLAIGLLVPDLALAAPRPLATPAAVKSDVTQAGGVYCDFNGCSDYGFRHRRRIYVDPPIYDEPRVYDPYDDPYAQPVIRRRPRVYVEPPRYYEPRPVYRPRTMMLSRSHVQWCLDRYRSYNPRTDLYMLRRGVWRHCISPYS